MNPLPPPAAQDLLAVRRRVPGSVWRAIIERTRAEAGSPSSESLAKVVGTPINADQAWLLRKSLGACGFASWPELTVALEVVDALAAMVVDSSEIVWSGPSNGTFPVRRFDQVLYDLIAAAQRRIFLVTFAAYRVPLLCQHLTAAIARNVSVTLLLEGEASSSGQLSHDAASAFKDVPLQKIRLLHWPRENREVNRSNRPGKLHAKCAVVDDSVIIGSANMTDDAFNRNMELGVLIGSAPFAQQLLNHFESLYTNCILRELGWV